MSTQHTQGLLCLDEQSGEIYAKDIGNWYGYQVAVCNHPMTDFPSDTIKANARRLVACWNLLEPFTTEQIEDFRNDLFSEVRRALEGGAK